MSNPNPCLSCGACCAYFRVSFHWTETTDYSSGTVPIELTEPVDGFRQAMRGTSQKQPRCVALDGTIGSAVHCAIYTKRSSTCQEFMPSWEDGTPNPLCDKARLNYGLLPLTPEIWQGPGDFPRLPIAA